MSDVRFDDRVAIITGAGNGLGRSHALALASRGAKVIVNDLGGSASGSGSDTSPADNVVDEILALGGEAAANYDSVLDGENIVQCALDNFGKIDVVINNAGILRDSSFHKMTEQDWDLVYDVHVKGAFKLTRAAWPYLREQEYGRIIFTASAAGIYGNFGQANYSMAKLGLHGLCQSLAIEGRTRNIFCNTIAPVAASRMTETIMPADLLKQLKPEFVSPLVLALCDEHHKDSGQLYEVGAGWIGKLRWERTEGVGFKTNQELTPEAIIEQWQHVIDYNHNSHPSNVQEALMQVIGNLKNNN